ncbi:MAG: glycerophosphodiester phosphodiesterase family protein [Hyphomicrobiales bacterium]
MRTAFANLKSLIVFGVTFQLFGTLIGTPLQAVFLRGLVETTGRTVLTNYDIAAFILTPWGLAWLVAALATSLLLLFGEQTGFLFIARGARTGDRLRTWQIWRMTGACLTRLLGVALLQTLAVVGCLVLFGAACALIYWVALAGNDINYYLSEWPPRFLIACAVAAPFVFALFAALALFVVRWSLALPICVFEGASWSAPLRRSWAATRGSGVAIGVSLIGWLLGIFLVLTAVTAAFVLAAEWVIQIIPQRAGIIIVTTGSLIVAIELVVGAITLVGIAGYGLLVEQTYDRLRGGVAPRGTATFETPAAPDGQPHQGMSWKWVAAGIVLFSALSIGSTYALVETAGPDRPVKATAHRGSSHAAPENTLSALRRAIEDGADFAEIDVQETADGVIVLLHDTDLKRTAGTNTNIWQASYDEIRGLDAGSWFSSDYAGETIPTLQQAIDEARGRIKLNIELKLNGHDRNLVRSVVRLIGENGFAAHCVVSSLTHSALKEVRALDPELRKGLIVTASIGDITRLDVDFLSLAHGRATSQMVARARRRGLGVHVWTVNRPDEMQEMIDLGVDNIITDRPDLLRAVIDERAGLGRFERLLLAVSRRLRSRR